MSRHIKIFSHDSQTTEEIIKLLNEFSTEHAVELDLETIEHDDEIKSYSIKQTPCIMLASLVIHEGGIPTKQQLLEWFI